VVDHPGELADTLEQFVFAHQMENGRTYAGRNHVGEFKKVDDVVYYKSINGDAEWIVITPHEKSLFRPTGYVRDEIEIDEAKEADQLDSKLQYITKQISEGYTEGYYPHWKLTRTTTGWDIRIGRE
jgi:hypothetical protein